MRFRAGFGDPNHRGWNAAGEVIYDYRKAVVQYTTEQVTYNTDCCGISVQFHRFNLVGLRNENQFRIAFSVANISTTLGNLKKQDRLF
jgi:LPS-assembly protein